jgi:hypothetical protein
MLDKPTSSNMDPIVKIVVEPLLSLCFKCSNMQVIGQTLTRPIQDLFCLNGTKIFHPRRPTARPDRRAVSPSRSNYFFPPTAANKTAARQTANCHHHTCIDCIGYQHSSAPGRTSGDPNRPAPCLGSADTLPIGTADRLFGIVGIFAAQRIRHKFVPTFGIFSSKTAQGLKCQGRIQLN